MPTTRPRTSGVWPTYFQPSTSVRQTLGRSSPRHRLPGRDVREPEDRGRADEERGGVDVEREVGLVDLRQGVVEHAGEQREAGEERRGDRCRAVRREQAELVGRLEPLPRDEVGDRRLLGGDPDQAATSMRNVATNSHHRVPTSGIDRNSANRADVADDHRPAPVQPVGDDAGERADEDGRRQPEDEDTRDGEVLLPRSRPSASRGARAVSASRPSQSPRLESDRAVHSRRNAAMRSTPRRSWSGRSRATTCRASLAYRARSPLHGRGRTAPPPSRAACTSWPRRTSRAPGQRRARPYDALPGRSRRSLIRASLSDHAPVITPFTAVNSPLP